MVATLGSISKMKSHQKHFLSRAELALLHNRSHDALTLIEFGDLLNSYNSVGANEQAFITARSATRKFPRNSKLLRWHRDTARGWLTWPDLIAEFRRCIDENVGPEAFWRLALADYYVDAAWADDEHMVGLLPAHPEWLSLAAQQLESAPVTGLDFRRYWGRAADDPQAMYEVVFDGLLRYETFAHLRRLR